MFVTNGWTINTLLPQCGAEFLHGVPWFHVPGALVSDAVYSAATPLGVRVRGLNIVFAWLGLTATIIGNLIRTPVLSAWALAAFVAILGLGVLPLTLVLMRGEQLLLLLLSALIGFPLLAGRWAKSGEHGRLALATVLRVLYCSQLVLLHASEDAFLYPVGAAVRRG